MTHKENILRPGKQMRVTRSADDEPLVRQSPRRLEEKHVQGGLAVVRVSAQVGKVAAKLRGAIHGPMYGGIDAAIKRRYALGAELGLQLCQCGATGVAQYQIESAETAWPDVGEGLPGAEPFERDGSIEIVEHV